MENLEWCTPDYNLYYGTRLDRIAQKSKDRAKPVLQYSTRGNLIKAYPSTTEVERKKGFNHSKIVAVCKGKRKTAYGFKWEYAVES